jgi:regulator of sirC expression with transglutaminase-like and TPR domain
MARGALVGAAMAVDAEWLEAAEARELAAPLAEEASELALAPAAPVAEAAALSRLEASEEASLRAEERADSAPLTAEPVAEARAESAAEVMDDRAGLLIRLTVHIANTAQNGRCPDTALK